MSWGRDGIGSLLRARAVRAHSTTDLVLWRGEVELSSQAVVVDWISRRGARDQGGIAAAEVDADVIFFRLDPFDVARNDRFTIQDQTGIVNRVYQDASMTYAEATIDVRS